MVVVLQKMMYRDQLSEKKGGIMGFSINWKSIRIVCIGVIRLGQEWNIHSHFRGFEYFFPAEYLLIPVWKHQQIS